MFVKLKKFIYKQLNLEKRKSVAELKKQSDKYFNRYIRNAFSDCNCKNREQFEASITRLYHTVEKGLSYENYRAGFGEENIKKLIKSLRQYSDRFDVETHVYKTALSVLYLYLKKNMEYGHNDEKLEKIIKSLPGNPNNDGGTIIINKVESSVVQKMGFKEFIESRHSIRHFSDEPVDIEKIIRSLQIAQFTPSACNRQGWNAYIIKDKNVIKNVLENQNGNRGFGNEIDKLLLLSFDLRYSNIDREVFQGFIDGGMYAANVINALYYEGIASIPLSASLSEKQEINIRSFVGIDDAEVLILFLGLGNYPKNCLTTKSTRRASRYKVI